MKRIICAALAASVLAGCATVPPPTYTSSAQYAGLDCPTLRNESRNTKRALEQQIQAKSSKDMATGAAIVVGALLFWPALFLIQSSSAEDAEIARLRADHDAIVEAANTKLCTGINNDGLPPPPAPAATTTSNTCVASGVAC
jgi:hypothetical protein